MAPLLDLLGELANLSLPGSRREAAGVLAALGALLFLVATGVFLASASGPSLAAAYEGLPRPLVVAGWIGAAMIAAAVLLFVLDLIAAERMSHQPPPRARR